MIKEVTKTSWYHLEPKGPLFRDKKLIENFFVSAVHILEQL